ncbi:MAG: RNA polymerase sporulation sigma factor SigK [Clostridia bacterium]|nr:RNA polymerase sporulation sigma factor SigK [Clostridia bacterium]
MFQALLTFLSDFALVAILHVMGAGSFPKPLSAKEEAEQLQRMKNGDRNARNILIEHNLRLVAHIVKKYCGNPNEQDDLVSIGTIGLIKAIDTFKADKNIKLSSYASRCIENEILMHFRAKKKNALDISLDETIDTDKDGNALTLMDIMSSEENLIDQIDSKINLEKVNNFIRSLPKREQTIIFMRYGLDGSEPLTQKEVAQALGISRSYVSRIEKKVIQQLSKKFS